MYYRSEWYFYERMNEHHIWINWQNILYCVLIRRTWLFKAPPTGGVDCWIVGWPTADVNNGCCCWYCKLGHGSALLKGDSIVNPEDANEATLDGNVVKLLTVGGPAVAVRADPTKGPAGETDKKALNR